MLLCTLGCMYLFNLSVFVFSSYVPRSGIAGSYVSSIFSFSFPHWLHQFTFPPAVYKGSLFSTPSPAFIVCVYKTHEIKFLNGIHFQKILHSQGLKTGSSRQDFLLNHLQLARFFYKFYLIQNVSNFKVFKIV